MENKKVEIRPYREEYKEQIVAVWEKSVRVTHNFLLPNDIEFFKGFVKDMNFNSFSVYCLLQENKVLGFLGLEDKKIEMLFLDPDVIGQGYGKMLMHVALHELQANKVDVNEQNEKAVRFYESIGFVTYERTEKDSTGKDYPILKMELSKGKGKF